MTDRPERDRGSIAPLVPIVMFALFVIGGLVVDGSRTLNSRGNAEAFAEEAARAGATATDNGTAALTLNHARATELVNSYCQAIRRTAHANVNISSCHLDDPAFTMAQTCDGSMQSIVVHVRVTAQIDTSLLGMIGIRHFSNTATAAARPFEGPVQGGDHRC